jgi:hypothetical protein
MFARTRDFAAGLALLCGSVFAAAQSAPLSAEQIKAAARTDDFTIPTPGEFMAALGKVGKPDWSSKTRPPSPRISPIAANSP